jgi:hypothetical protein
VCGGRRNRRPASTLAVTCDFWTKVEKSLFTGEIVNYIHLNESFGTTKEIN